jgi:hypothetical protein
LPGFADDLFRRAYADSASIKDAGGDAGRA